MTKHGVFGLWDFNKNKITLQQSTKQHILTKEQVESTFVHEAVHAMLDHMGYHELSADERFVSSYSNLIYQFIGNE